LHFAAQARRAGQDYTVTLYDGAHKPLSTVHLVHYGGDPVPGSWKVYDIPLSDLRANATHIRGIAIQSRSHRYATLYLDSMSLTGLFSSQTPTPTSTSAPTPTPTSTPTPTPSATPSPASTPTPPPTPSATPAPTTNWKVDYETGNLSQWSQVNTGKNSGNGSIQVVTDPVREGSYAAKFTLTGTGGSQAVRAETAATQAQTGGYEGQDWYYSWSMYVPSNPNQTTGWGSWNVITQWMDLLHQCAPPVAVDISPSSNSSTGYVWSIWSILKDGKNGCASLGPTQHWNLAPVQYDQWTDFTVHLKWSANPTIGFVEVWINGTKVLPLTYIRTLDTGGGVYEQADIYRPDFTGTNIIYFDDHCM